MIRRLRGHGVCDDGRRLHGENEFSLDFALMAPPMHRTWDPKDHLVHQLPPEDLLASCGSCVFTGIPLSDHRHDDRRVHLPSDCELADHPQRPTGLPHCHHVQLQQNQGIPAEKLPQKRLGFDEDGYL